MKVSIAVEPVLACSALLGFQSLSMAQTQTPAPQPPAQPSYPSAPAPRNRVNQPAEAPAPKADEPRCTNLKGVEKAECERRDTTDDDAPAGVTSSMREKQKEAARENADTSADTAADTAKEKPSSAKRSSEAAKPKVDEKRMQNGEKSRTDADEADTLGKPPA